MLSKGSELRIGFTNNVKSLVQYRCHTLLDPNLFCYSDGLRASGFYAAGKEIDLGVRLPSYEENDVVGFVLDISANQLVIYKNNKKWAIFSPLPKERPLFPCVALDDRDDLVELLRWSPGK